MEQIHISYDEYATFLTVIADRRVIEIAIESAENIGAAYNGRVYYRVVVGVRGDDAWSRAREHHLRNVACAKKA
jgi:hypothetical protein